MVALDIPAHIVKWQRTFNVLIRTIRQIINMPAGKQYFIKVFFRIIPIKPIKQSEKVE